MMTEDEARKKRAATRAMSAIGVDEDTWLYVEKKGLCVVRQVKDRRGKIVAGDIFYLPWRKVRKSVSLHLAAFGKD